MPDATPETACGTLYRFLGVHSAVRAMLRQHGTLTAWGFTFWLDPTGGVRVNPVEDPDAMHASELDGPASFVVADAVTNPADLTVEAVRG